MNDRPQSRTRFAGLSLRLKFTLWIVAIAAVVHIALTTVLLFYQRSELDTFFDNRLRVRAETLSDDIRRPGFDLTDEGLRTAVEHARRSMLTEGRMAVLFANDGSVVASNIRPVPTAETLDVSHRLASSRPAEVFVLEVPELEDELGSDRARAILVPVEVTDGQPLVLFLATSDTYFNSMIDHTARVLLLSIPLGIGAVAVAGWLLGGLATRPFEHFKRLSKALSPELIERDLASAIPLPEFRALEADLEETRAKLRRAFLAHDRFVSNVSHELKTPIATLLIEGQTLTVESLPPDAKAFVRSVTEEMQRLGRMIDSFLTLTRIRSGNGLPNPRLCEANEVVAEAVTRCARMARQHGVTLAPTLDESDPPLRFCGDDELLRVLVENLVRNAVRFSTPGQTVQVRVTPSDSEIRITVRDFGPGVPPELIDRLFDRFVQAPEESARSRGHGLGLAIAQGIAELHGGSIEVRNQESGGCEFSVRLPRHTEAVRSSPSASEAGRQPVPAHSGRG